MLLNLGPQVVVSYIHGSIGLPPVLYTTHNATNPHCAVQVVTSHMAFSNHFIVNGMEVDSESHPWGIFDWRTVKKKNIIEP